MYAFDGRKGQREYRMECVNLCVVHVCVTIFIALQKSYDLQLKTEIH